MIKRFQKGTELFRNGLLSVKDAAKFLGVSTSHVYTLMDSGSLVYSKIGRVRRIPLNALIQLAKKNTVSRLEDEHHGH